MKNLTLLLLVFCGFFIENTKGQNLVLPEGFPEYQFPYNNSPDDGYLFITSRPCKL
jgi:hypothetical protein